MFLVLKSLCKRQSQVLCRGLRLKTTAIINIYIRSNIFFNVFRPTFAIQKQRVPRLSRATKDSTSGFRLSPQKVSECRLQEMSTLTHRCNAVTSWASAGIGWKISSWQTTSGATCRVVRPLTQWIIICNCSKFRFE